MEISPIYEKTPAETGHVYAKGKPFAGCHMVSLVGAGISQDLANSLDSDICFYLGFLCELPKQDFCGGTASFSNTSHMS